MYRYVVAWCGIHLVCIFEVFMQLYIVKLHAGQLGTGVRRGTAGAGARSNGFNVRPVPGVTKTGRGLPSRRQLWRTIAAASSFPELPACHHIKN